MPGRDPVDRRLWFAVLSAGVVAALVLVVPAFWKAAAAGRGVSDPTGATQFRYNQTTGQFKFGTTGQGTWSPGWQVFPANWDGNTATDFFLFKPTTGQWYRATNNGGGGFTYFPSAAAGQWDTGWTVEVADLNGDGRSDVFLYNPTTGGWFRCLFTSATGDFQYTGGTWSSGWDIYSADFNADGRTDLFLYDPAAGGWYKVFSQANGTFTYTGGQWSAGWDIHDTCDFNGDGRGDLFLYSQATGAWFQVMSQADASFAYSGGQWSPGWDITVADITGDNKDDVFMYDVNTGVYYAATTTGSFSYSKGTLSPGWTVDSYDFNGDGAADFVLSNPATGAYYQALSIGAGQFNWTSGDWGVGYMVIVPPMTAAFRYSAPTPPPAPVPTPTPPPACTALICDDLQGSTVGQQVGGSWDSFGFVVTDGNAGIVYNVSPTITSGYFEFEATGLHYPSVDTKDSKIYAMTDGAWSSDDPYRATAELRGPPRNYVRTKFLTGSNTAYIESDISIPWNPNDIFKVRLEWGPSKRMKLIVTNLTTGAGPWVLDQAYGNGGTYNPANQVIRIGNPGAGGHSSFPGFRARKFRAGRF